jgi:hypothetical protein
MSLITNKGRGWNLYQNSANMAKDATKWTRGIGNGLGYITTGISLYNFGQNPTFRNGFSFAESVGSLLYWPFGLADAYIHFGTDVVVPDVQRHQLDMLERIDNGTFNPWDYRNMYPY